MDEPSPAAGHPGLRLGDLGNGLRPGQLESACGAPHFLGARFSAIDLYLVAMSHWRPGTKWWEANAPKLLAAAHVAMKKAEVARLVARDFG